jgi:hypothetical protein
MSEAYQTVPRARADMPVTGQSSDWLPIGLTKALGLALYEHIST